MLMLVFAVMGYVLVHQLFELQIIQGEDYIHKFQTKTTKTRVIKSTRGNIYDRNGTVLASNVLSYSLTLEDNGSYPSTREKNLTLNGVAYRVLQILSSNGDSLSNTFHIYVDENECVQSRQMYGITHWMPLPAPPAKLSSLERTGKKWKE